MGSPHRDEGLSPELRVDLLVVGCGMAGMTAAARAAESGACVLCVDRAPRIGGSALLSHSFVWTADTVEEFLAACPECDPALAATVVGTYPALMEWFAELQIEMGDVAPVLHGRGRPVDLVSYFDRARRLVESAGGWVLPSRTVETLIHDDGTVRGARVRDDSGVVDVLATRTLLATGGFQGNRAVLEAHFGEQSRGLTHRSNPYSVGDGLRLALAAGADTAGPMDAFYGHLIPWPLIRFGPPEFGRLIMSFSDHGLLLNEKGERFTDESLGDHHNNQSTAAQPGSWACLVFDDHVRSTFADRAAMAGMEHTDKLQEASKAGACVLTSDTIDGLVSKLPAWGVPAETAAQSVAGYNHLLDGGVHLLDGGVPGEVPRRKNRQAVSVAPFFALRVVPTITFTLGGIRIDRGARVIDPSGQPIGGLYAAGGDIGGAFGRGYSGGLAMSAVLGYLTARGLGSS